jgi:hypothetical protein
MAIGLSNSIDTPEKCFFCDENAPQAKELM